MLAEQLGGSLSTAQTTAAAFCPVRRRLAASATAGRRSLLIVDEAHLIDDPATFESLRLLLNFASTGPPDLSLVLVGTAELMLQLPPSLVDRLAARCLLGPLTEAESSAYIQGRLAAAGATSALFSPDAFSPSIAPPLAYPAASTFWLISRSWLLSPRAEPRLNPRIVALAAQEFQTDPLAA